jgi:hypothetical protein
MIPSSQVKMLASKMFASLAERTAQNRESAKGASCPSQCFSVPPRGKEAETVSGGDLLECSPISRSVNDAM